MILAETPKINRHAAYTVPSQCAAQCTESQYTFYGVKIFSPTQLSCLCVTKVDRNFVLSLISWIIVYDLHWVTFLSFISQKLINSALNFKGNE